MRPARLARSPRLLVFACCLALLIPGSNASSQQGGPHAAWTVYGTGFVRAIELADLDADGRDDLIVGGRGMGAITEASLRTGRFQWVNKWPPGTQPERASDNDFAEGLAVDDVNGDGVADALVGGGRGLHAIDGANGSDIWTRHVPSLQGFDNIWEISSGDLNDDGVSDVVYAPFIHDKMFAVDGRDGSELWSHPIVGISSGFEVADLGGDAAEEVVRIGTDLVTSKEVQAVTTVTAGGETIALPLWLQDMPGGDPTESAVGQVVAGDWQEVVVGGYNGEIAVFDGLTGQQLATWEGAGAIRDILLLQLDADPGLEIVTATGYEDDGGYDAAIQAWDADGTPLWSLTPPSPVADLDPVDVDGDGALDIVAGGGWVTFGGRGDLDGYAMAVSPSGTPQWERAYPARVSVVQGGEAFGRPTILVGHDTEGGLRGLDLQGNERWIFPTGGATQTVTGADLDGDGRDEVLVGDDDAGLSIRSPSGDLLSTVRIPGRGAPDVMTIAAGDVTPDLGTEIAVGTFEYEDGGPGGKVHLYSRDGRRLWSDGAPGSFGTVRVADLEGDGRQEILAGSGGRGLGGDGARIVRYDAEGAVEWKTPVPPSLGLLVEVLELNDDGVDDVVIGTTPLLSTPHLLGIDGRDGSVLWDYEFDRFLEWIDASADGIVAGDTVGGVRVFERDGRVAWTTPTAGGRSNEGGWTVDADRDGYAEVVAVSESDTVEVLRGIDGSLLWRSPVATGEDGFPSRVTTLRGPSPAIAVGTSSNTNGRRSAVSLYDAITGALLGSIPTDHHVQIVTTGDLDGDGAEEALAGSGWQVHAIRR